MADAGRSQQRDERAALVRGGGGKPLAQLPVARVDAQLPARLGVDEPELPHVGQLLLARIADLDRECRVACRDAKERHTPVAAAAEVGHDDDERALHGDAVDERERAGEAAAARGVLVAERLERVEERGAPLPRAAQARGLGAERHEAEPVAAPRRGVADGERHPLGDVGLAPVGGAERHRRGRIQHEPRDEDALGELDAHVRPPGARGDVPLDPAHVVAGLVLPHLVQLAANPREGRAVVAREEPVDAPADGQLERPQARARERAGSRPRGRPFRGDRVVEPSHAAAVSVRPRSSCGTGTLSSTASRIRSGATSSASAWYESTRRCRNASRTSACRSATTT